MFRARGYWAAQRFKLSEVFFDTAQVGGGAKYDSRMARPSLGQILMMTMQDTCLVAIVITARSRYQWLHRMRTQQKSRNPHKSAKIRIPNHCSARKKKKKKETKSLLRLVPDDPIKLLNALIQTFHFLSQLLFQTFRQMTVQLGLVPLLLRHTTQEMKSSHNAWPSKSRSLSFPRPGP